MTTSPSRAAMGWIKARWVCEQAHQQFKEELGLDHFEGRSWTGLHRHALMTNDRLRSPESFFRPAALRRRDWRKANDHDELRHDPMMAILAGKLAARREDCAPVAGKSTLNGWS